MLINPYRHQNIPTFPGTRLVSIDLGVMGMSVNDPWRTGRIWSVRGIYSRTGKRALGGLRIKLEDNKNFVTFCNQRDFEVLIGLGKPGSLCIWADQDYVGPTSDKWCGLCADDADLLDDLFDREMSLRVEIPGVLPDGLEIERRVHISRGLDVRDLFMLISDADIDGFGPDPRIKTLELRWSRVEREREPWHLITD